MSIQVKEGVKKEVLRSAAEGQPGPPVGATITVHCIGSLATGKKFWSTKDAGQQPFSFEVGLGNVIQGWDEGCLSMKLGEVAKLHIAANKGYGSRGFPAWGIPPNADLVFEIEILSIGKKA